MGSRALLRLSSSPWLEFTNVIGFSAVGTAGVATPCLKFCVSAEVRLGWLVSVSWSVGTSRAPTAELASVRLHSKNIKNSTKYTSLIPTVCQSFIVSFTSSLHRRLTSSPSAAAFTTNLQKCARLPVIFMCGQERKQVLVFQTGPRKLHFLFLWIPQRPVPSFGNVEPKCLREKQRVFVGATG